MYSPGKEVLVVEALEEIILNEGVFDAAASISRGIIIGCQGGGFTSNAEAADAAAVVVAVTAVATASASIH